MTTLRKRRDETEWQFRSRLARARQEARDRSEPIVPKEAERHGDYEKGFVTHVETATKAYTVVNRGGTPLCRWIAAGKLSDSQMLAIQECRRLWAIAGVEQRTTANYGERLAASSHSDDHRAIVEIEAREDLRRIQGYFKGLEKWWQIFENVVRFDEPAGVAGSRLGFGSRSSEDRAHTVVCLVADIIAEKERLSRARHTRAV